MTGPTHRVWIVSRDGSRIRRFSHPPIDRGGNATLLAGGEVVDGFDWERAYRIVGTVRVVPTDHLIDLDNFRELMKIERVVPADVVGEWLVYATWTGRYDNAGFAGPWVWGADENVWAWGGADNTWDWGVQES